MTIFTRVGGVWKAPTKVWVRVGGLWKSCTNVYTKSGGAWKLAFTSAVGLFVVSPLGPASNSQDLPLGASGSSQIVIGADGSISGNSEFSGPTQWLSTVSAGNGSGFWVRATITSGLFNGSSSAAGVWLPMTSTRNFQRTVGANSGNSTTFTVEFSTDSAGSTIVCTSTGWIISNTHS